MKQLFKISLVALSATIIMSCNSSTSTNGDISATSNSSSAESVKISNPFDGEYGITKSFFVFSQGAYSQRQEKIKLVITTENQDLKVDLDLNETQTITAKATLKDSIAEFSASISVGGESKKADFTLSFIGDKVQILQKDESGIHTLGVVSKRQEHINLCDTVVMKAFAQNIISAFSKKDKEKIAKLVEYPIIIGKTKISNEELFLKVFDVIFDEKYIKTIAEGKFCSEGTAGTYSINCNGTLRFTMNDTNVGLRIIAFNTQMN